MEHVLVSIIIPVYNAEKRLNRCIDSVLKQTLKEVEIICVDDGSTDDSLKILQNYQNKSNKIKVFHQENRGVYRARMLGIQKASGKYVGFVDSDDEINPDMFHILYELAEDTYADMVVCAYERIQHTTNKILSREMACFGKQVVEIEKDASILGVTNTSLWNKLILREIVVNHIVFEQPPRIMEDMMFLASLFPRIKRVAFTDKVLYQYYVYEDSAMSAVFTKDVEIILKAMKETRLFIEKVNNSEKIMRLFQLIAFIHLGISLPILAGKEDWRQINNVKVIIEKWLNNEFGNWKQNPFLKINFILNGHKYLLKPWFVLQTYKLNVFTLFVVIYNYVTTKYNFTIKW